MFSGLLTDLDPNEIAALLSVLVHDEKSSDTNVNIKNEKLAKAYQALIDHGRRIVKVYQEAKINVEEVTNK